MGGPGTFAALKMLLGGASVGRSLGEGEASVIAPRTLLFVERGDAGPTAREGACREKAAQQTASTQKWDQQTTTYRSNSGYGKSLKYNIFNDKRANVRTKKRKETILAESHGTRGALRAREEH